jgi:hypothetical protein
VSKLARVDDDWVPRAARAIRRAVRWLSGRAGGPAGQVSRVAEEEPALTASVATVLVAAVLVAAFGGDRTLDSDRRSAVDVPPSVPLVATVGPPPGTSVSTYLSRAEFNLRHFGTIAASRPTNAVVHLERYLTPNEAGNVLAGVRVERAYIRVPGKLPTIYRSVTIDTLGQLEAEMAAAGRSATEVAESYKALINALRPNAAADRQVRRQYVLNRRASLFEARKLGRPAGCACVFAVVVRGTFDQLAHLAARDGVRAVDPAPAVVPLSSLTVFPLQPQITTVVPRDRPAGG